MENLDFNIEHWSNGPCPKFDCRKKGKCDCCGLRYVNIPAVLEKDMKPENGAFSNAIVEYEGTGRVWIYSSEGIPTLVKDIIPDVCDDWGNITYLDQNNKSRTATIKNMAEFMSLGNMANSYSVTVDGKDILNTRITGVRIGKSATYIPDYFLHNSTLLTTVDGLENVLSIGTLFLGGCTSFNQQLIFNQNIKKIGNNFLGDCTSFDKPIVIPNSITSMGTNFLSGCTSFNKSLTMSDTLTGINTGLLLNCESFNQPLILPDNITYISANFLKGCSSFNQKLELPSSLTRIDGAFMNDCKNMVSIIYLGDLDASIISAPSQLTRENYLSTIDASAACYVHGIGLNGTYVANWMSMLPNGARSGGYYRKLYNANS